MINIKNLTFDRSELRHVWEGFCPGMRHVCPNMWEDFGPGMRQYVERLWISHPKGDYLTFNLHQSSVAKLTKA